MKIDKKNYRHWIALIRFGLNVIAAILLRPLCRRRQEKVVILYGHRLAGNLKPIYQYMRSHAGFGIEMSYLTMDARYHHELVANGVSSVLATTSGARRLLARADALISDHGLHVIAPMQFLSDMKFFDVWHGIPFKGFDPADFGPQLRYDEVWVASPLMQELYVQRYGFEPTLVKATGYSRTDCLVRQDADIPNLKRRFGLDDPDIGRIVLFAPTWKQDAAKRSLFPFGLDEDQFFSQLSLLAQRTRSTFVMRTHMNSAASLQSHWDRIVQRPYVSYPDTEDLLLISDMLVCDWSSIAFDFLLLDRPTIFLDVEAPFAKGFSLDPGYRFGAIAGSMAALLDLMETYLDDPAKYREAYAEKAKCIARCVYGGFADGRATERCIARLMQSLDRDFGLGKAG